MRVDEDGVRGDVMADGTVLGTASIDDADNLTLVVDDAALRRLLVAVLGSGPAVPGASGG